MALIRWIVIYPTDSAIHPLNNWGQVVVVASPANTTFTRVLLMANESSYPKMARGLYLWCWPKGSRPLEREDAANSIFLQPQVTQLVCCSKQTLTSFNNLPQKMNPSREFWHGLVYGMVIAIIVILLLIETSPQEQRAKKRGPEENDDNCSWEGKEYSTVLIS